MIRNDILELTKELVRIKSINGTTGEADIAAFLLSYMKDFPYFKAHPDYLISVPIPDDPLGRSSVIAFFRGEKDENTKTLLLHGHIDTVGLEGYGPLTPYACDPDELEKHYRDVDLPEAFEKDLSSGDFLFGRGSCDMKSGDAVFIRLLKDFSDHPEEFSGNLILSLNPVEENMHTGIITSLDTIRKLRDEYGLTFVAALNNDFTAPLFPGDETKTIYTGIGGKVLPCFYIQGKETHVGQCFEGFDASLVAAELVRRISLSMDFEDTFEGETAYPPSVLKMKDLKTWYNVQTAKEALVYFNYFVHDASITAIRDRLLAAAKDSFAAVNDTVNREYRRFAAVSGEEEKRWSYEPKILAYSDLLALAEKSEGYDARAVSEIIHEEKEKGTDAREIAVPVIRYLLAAAGITDPAVVLYFAPPYCPHSTFKEGQKDLLRKLKAAAAGVTEETGTAYRFMKFYPSLSDSSYLKIDDDDESIDALLKNFPAWKETYDLPIDAIRSLNIPAMNIGTYGADCHKWTERVNIPYTFGVLPLLETKLIRSLLAI